MVRIGSPDTAEALSLQRMETVGFRFFTDVAAAEVEEVGVLDAVGFGETVRIAVEDGLDSAAGVTVAVAKLGATGSAEGVPGSELAAEHALTRTKTDESSIPVRTGGVVDNARI